MIPACVIQNLLETLLKEVQTIHSEPDYLRYRTLESIEEKSTLFEDLLFYSEDDLSIIADMMARDHDYKGANAIRKLRSLVDYLEITLAVYDPRPSNHCICNKMHQI